MSGPISPSEARDGSQVPPEAFEIVNALLRAGQRRITQDQVVRALVSRLDISRDKVFARGMLEFEGAYRAKGWRVEYDRPGFNEGGEAFWIFSETP